MKKLRNLWYKNLDGIVMSNYWLKMSYPENNITFYYGENKLGFLKDEAVQKFLTSEELEELEDTGYLDVDQRFGEALKKYVKTGEFELRKPIRRLQTVKYVRESLNESTMNLSKKYENKILKICLRKKRIGF